MAFKSAAVLAREREASDGPEVLTVSELCDRLRAVVRSLPGPVHVYGEVRDLVRPPSGHTYFTIRDEGAQITCVLFRADAADRSAVRDGLSVLIRADLDFYATRGLPQLVVRSIHPRGVGDLWVAFEATKAALAREGLLDAARKRPLPPFPDRVGLVTSEAGQAMHDVVQILRRRYPLATVVLSPAAVQGEAAPASLVAALHRLGAVPVDVIIVARGGGSTEDLWAFNDEGLARAIAAAPVPVVVAVGHETDITIAGLVADVRAPTPSAAAQAVAPDFADLAREVRSAKADLVREGWRVVRDLRQRADGLGASLTPEALGGALAETRHRLASARARLLDAGRQFRRHREALDALFRRLDAVGPLPTLRRGYAIALRDAQVVSSASSLRVGDDLLLRFQDGDVGCRVTNA